MKILYISPLWSGVVEAFTEGVGDFHGMPAFTKVLEELYSDERVLKIVIIFFSRSSLKPNVADRFNDKIDVQIIHYRSNTQLLLFAPIFLLRIWRRIRVEAPDVIYGHGALGFFGKMASTLSNRPFVQRIYGSFLIDKIKQSQLALFLRHPLEVMAFKSKASNTIITNDGTHGDKVYEKLNGDTSRLRFLINGVEKGQPVTFEERASSPPLLTYIARLDHWKRQDLFVSALSHLKKHHKVDFEAEIIGAIFNESYKADLEDQINSNGLRDAVRICGPLSYQETSEYRKRSTMTCSFYNTSNLGNVFLESLCDGTPIVAINCNESLSAIPDTIYCQVPGKVEKISAAIHRLIKDQTERRRLSEESYRWAETNLLTWKERAKVEVKLLMEAGGLVSN